jgi:hypothetical protein
MRLSFFSIEPFDVLPTTVFFSDLAGETDLDLTVDFDTILDFQ